jgi:serine/threonine protein kinase
VSDALTFAHSKNVYHLDVHPGNIIFDGSHFVLVDWGCAACGNDEIVGFRGSFPFAHSEVLNIYGKNCWKPAAKHDIALMFTVCVLWENNSVPWPEFHNRRFHDDDTDDEAFEHRRVHTKKKSHGFVQEIRRW